MKSFANEIVENLTNTSQLCLFKLRDFLGC